MFHPSMNKQLPTDHLTGATTLPYGPDETGAKN